MKLYISHSSRDGQEAAQLESWLRQQGYEVVRLTHGKKQEAEPDDAITTLINSTVDTVDVMVYLVSPFWQTSPLCRLERQRGDAADKLAIALIVAPTPQTDLGVFEAKLDLTLDRRAAQNMLLETLASYSARPKISEDVQAEREADSTPVVEEIEVEVPTIDINALELAASSEKEEEKATFGLEVSSEVSLSDTADGSPKEILAADADDETLEKAPKGRTFEYRIKMSIEQARAAMKTTVLPEWLAWALQSPETRTRERRTCENEKTAGTQEAPRWAVPIPRINHDELPPVPVLKAPVEADFRRRFTPVRWVMAEVKEFGVWLSADATRVVGASVTSLVVIGVVAGVLIANPFGQERQIRQELQDVKSRQAQFLSKIADHLLETGDVENAQLVALEAVEQEHNQHEGLQAKVSLYTAWLQGQKKLVFSGHGNHVSDVSFSSDGRYLISASWDETVRVWDIRNGRQVLAIEGHDSLINSSRFSPDRKKIVTAAVDNKARLFDAGTGNLLHTFEGHSDDLTDAEFSPDGKKIITASADHTAILWDVDSSKALKTFSGHRGGVESASFSHDGGRIVTASVDGTARVFDVSSGEQRVILKGHGAPVRSAQFDPTGGYVLTASEDRTARLWNAYSGTEVRSFIGHQWAVLSASFSKNGRRVVTASKDNTARLWNALTGEPLMIFKGHTGIVARAVFSPNERFIATASGDGTIRLWPLVVSTEKLVSEVRDSVGKCLTVEQRRKYFLDDKPPAWCIEMKKRPYNTDDWQAWLQASSSGDNPPLPTGSIR